MSYYASKSRYNPQTSIKIIHVSENQQIQTANSFMPHLHLLGETDGIFIHGVVVMDKVRSSFSIFIQGSDEQLQL